VNYQSNFPVAIATAHSVGATVVQILLMVFVGSAMIIANLN
jgi:hypothetical protein